MKLETIRLSRRHLLRNAAIGATGLAAAFVVGCGDDEDEAAVPSQVATGTPDGNGDNTAAKDFKLVTGWFRDQEVKYYDFGANTKLSGAGVASAAIYPFITGMNADGTPKFVQGQHNLIDVVPGDAGYSDLWKVTMVTVGEGYEPDSIKSKADLDRAGLTMTETEMFVNCPVVPAGSTLEGGEALVQGWFKGDAVFYPDFGANPPTALPIWVFITGLNADGTPHFAAGQNNIIDSVPGDEGYSAFWRVNMVTVPDGYESNSIRSAADAVSSGFEIQETDMVVNCPVTEF